MGLQSKEQKAASFEQSHAFSIVYDDDADDLITADDEFELSEGESKRAASVQMMLLLSLMVLIFILTTPSRSRSV